MKFCLLLLISFFLTSTSYGRTCRLDSQSQYQLALENLLKYEAYARIVIERMSLQKVARQGGGKGKEFLCNVIENIFPDWGLTFRLLNGDCPNIVKQTEEYGKRLEQYRIYSQKIKEECDSRGPHPQGEHLIENRASETQH